MAGATVATWVKVRTKTGLTSRPISHKYEGGAGFEKGQTITQSEYNEIKANRSQKVQEAAGKLAENVRTVTAEVVDSMPVGERKSRFSKLIDDLDELDRQDIKNTSQLLGVAAELMVMTEKYTGVKPRESTTQTALPPVSEPDRKGGSRFGNLISDIEDIQKTNTKINAQLFGVTAKLYDNLDKLIKNQTPKKPPASRDRPVLNPSKKPNK